MGDSNTNTIIVKNKDEQQPTNPNPVLSLFSNFTKFFNFPQPKSVATNPEAKVEPVEPAAGVDKTQSKPVVASFPNRQTVAPLKLEPEDLEKDTNTNPVVLWQVYAIGGFFVLKWAWARWNERKAKKKTSGDSEDPPPADQ